MKGQEWMCTTGLHIVAGDWRGRTRRIVRWPNRRLILVDIENYCGKGALLPEDVRYAREGIAHDVGLRDEDLVVIGTSHGHNCFTCGSEWAGPRHVFRNGHDGADIALIDASREYRLDTFSSVVIVSGDGIFTAVARMMRAEGRRVEVLSEERHLSRSLRVAATDVIAVRSQVMSAA